MLLVSLLPLFSHPPLEESSSSAHLSQCPRSVENHVIPTWTAHAVHSVRYFTLCFTIYAVHIK